MGLDMYLGSRNKIEKNIVNDEIAYWRKFNALHSWFVENVQDNVDDCGLYPISRGELVDLISLLERVRDEKNTSLLPTKSGFFFGSTEYDESYWEDVSLSIDKLKNILEKFDFDNLELYYESSW